MNEERRFFDQFIEDYFSETEEHLDSVRSVLLELDSRSGQMAPAGLVQALARSLHTLKGLSGMVGLGTAERLAHVMEDRARGLSEFRNVDGAIVQDLFEGATLLERCVAARRANTSPPAIDDYVARAGSRPLSEGGAGTEVPGPSDGGALRTRSAEATEVTFTFTPSADAAARGAGVEAVRERLQSIGSIVQASPRVLAGGRVVFEFVVAVRGDAAPLEAWRDDGMSWDAALFERSKPGALVPTVPVSPGIPLAPVASTAVRVDLARLDDIMRLVGDLVVSRARIDEMLDGQVAAAGGPARWDDLRDANAIMERQLRALREGVTRIRLVPIGEVFERMRFAMREIARELDKTIVLEVHGQDTEIDKLVVDRMLEPLLHLVRNAASHGIEPAEERVARGKPPEGRIALRARAEGDRIFLEVEDDGGGIDVERVTTRAREMGLLSASEDLVDADLLDVLCEPGFSTRSSADMASGRGVGMAVVRAAVHGLGGALSVQTTRGAGTRYVVELPLTLMIADALLFEVGDQAFAVPQLVLREILQLEPSSVTRIENNDVIPYRESVLPLILLRRVFNIASADALGRYVLIVGSDNQLSGLVIDRIVGLREIVVHPVSDPLIALPGIAGATELPNGRVSLIIDAAAIVRRGRDDSHRTTTPAVPARTHRPVRELTR